MKDDIFKDENNKKYIKLKSCDFIFPYYYYSLYFLVLYPLYYFFDCKFSKKHTFLMRKIQFFHFL